ncbi:MAG: L-threonylcarbamoyladenylate synthase [Pseudomonadota bacterium]
MSPVHLRLAARVLHDGGLIAYPTEAVYGLGCDPTNEEAVERLLELKQRPVEKGLILIASKMDQLAPYIDWPALNDQQRARIMQSWPGPFTWLIPALPDTPVWLRGKYNSLAVRITAHPIAAALCEAAGSALVSTSANLSGHRPARSALEARQALGDRLDYILPGRVGGAAKPSTITDAVTGRVVRPG